MIFDINTVKYLLSMERVTPETKNKYIKCIENKSQFNFYGKEFIPVNGGYKIKDYDDKDYESIFDVVYNSPLKVKLQFVEDYLNINKIIAENDVIGLYQLAFLSYDSTVWLYSINTGKFISTKHPSQDSVKNVIKNKLPFKVMLNNDKLISANYSGNNYVVKDLTNFMTQDDHNNINYIKVMQKI